ncbi:MAG: cupin domain-containing protein [Candidatus Heimdallarchaeum aukensis]|uniref:Cupin domain-containing protein n=1 Tax=Candidatus Heimdallarchaeum aukensis TaxID=2876573 RepID=A0A9Y1BM58_9ARCH|nr:MAG: cupin domain-containing protein [Candidatus Heimdallarchaeum aukensis]
MIKKHYDQVEKLDVTDYGSTGTTIRWLITKEDGAPRFTMRRFEIEPNGQIGMHSHPQEHEIYILQGTGIVYNDKEEFNVKAHDVLFVPPDEPHGYKNTGNENFTFICVIPYLE